jgi:hypothetical protein
MTKMTHRTDLTIVVKIVDLDISHIYSPNHMVGMDKISSSEACRLNILKWGQPPLRKNYYKYT